MQRVARIFTNGHAKTAVPRDVLDGVADLRDFCIDPETRCTSTVAGEAISGLHRLYHLGETDKAKQAYAALHRLRERNWEYAGQDIPVNHVTVNKSFQDVAASLIHALERDHLQALSREGRAR